MSKLHITVDYVVMATVLKALRYQIDKLINILDKAAIEAGEKNGERRILTPDRRAWLGRREEDE